jgi:hypothetical protein
MKIWNIRFVAPSKLGLGQHNQIGLNIGCEWAKIGSEVERKISKYTFEPILAHLIYRLIWLWWPRPNFECSIKRLFQIFVIVERSGIVNGCEIMKCQDAFCETIKFRNTNPLCISSQQAGSRQIQKISFWIFTGKVTSKGKITRKNQICGQNWDISIKSSKKCQNFTSMVTIYRQHLLFRRPR